MKKSDLERQINAIESERGNPTHTQSAEAATNEQVKLNKLFIRLINEFNESTSKYNAWLIGLTVTIAILTLLMLLKMFAATK